MKKGVSTKKRIVNLPFLFFCCLATALVILGVIAWGWDYQSMVISNESLAEFNQGWKISVDGKELGEYDLPQELNLPKGAVVTMRNTIPLALKQNSTLFFRSSQSFVRVLVGDRVLHSFGYEAEPVLGKSPGSAWQIMRIPAANFGDDLTIELKSVYGKYSGNLGDVFIGTKAAIVFSIIRQNLFGAILCVLIFISGIGMWLLYFFVANILRDKRLLYLGYFAVILAFLALSETKILQLRFGNMQLISSIAFLSLPLLPICFMLFLGCFSVFRHKPMIRICFYVSVLNFIAINLLQFLGIADYFEMVSFTHIIIVVMILYIIIKSLWLLKANPGDRDSFVLCASIFVMFIFVVLDLIRFYQNVVVDNLFFSRIGFLLFVIILGGWSGKQAILSYSQRIEQATLCSLAYTDALTQLKNRTAFERHMDRLRGLVVYEQDVIIIMFDVNNLKEINDYFGHAAGDKILLDVALTIEKHFGNYGICYRIGGDEYCVICEGLQCEAVVGLLGNLQQHLQQLSAMRSAKLSVATGLACYSGGSSLDIDAVFRQADQAMYDCKAQMKGTLNRRREDSRH